MSFVPFKFKKANALTRLARFDGLPTWEDLASKITKLFNIPPDRVGVAFINEVEEAVLLTDEEELQCFYMSLDQSSEEIKFVVQDMHTPDAPTTIASTWSARYKSDNEFTLLCWILDTPHMPFSVNIEKDKTVDRLQKVIKKTQEHAFAGIDYDTFDLWKLSLPIPSSELNAKLGHVQIPDEITGSIKLHTFDILSKHFSSPLPEHLHIVVQLPPIHSRPFKGACLSFPYAPLNASPRSDTVAALYQRLKNYAFVQVRGTPASGKTMLAKLLADHISRQDPNVHIVWVDGWPLKESGNYRSYLKQKGWVEGKKTVFIFDEAQSSYKDSELWGEFFKSMHEYHERRAIVFASYGNPTEYMSAEGIRMIVPDSQQVTLRHVNHEDGLPPAGLLFTRSEFDDLVIKHYPFSDFCFDSSFFDALFDITNGHVGAIHAFTAIIIAHDSYRNLKHTTGHLYTWNSFLAKVSPRELLRKLENSASQFGRGLPSNMELQAPATASIFSAVLRRNVVMDDDFKTKDEKCTLQKCFHNGWLHADNLSAIDLPEDIGYFFPSSLHRWYVEWTLLDVLLPTQFQANSLLDFVIDVIHLFSPRLLLDERRIGLGCIQRLPEVQYQDELYRCCHTLSKGSVVTFPEFGTAKGRVDFYIPAKSWGIELLRDGNQLARHCGRFSQTGSYNTTLPLSEHIIVDCRTTHPKEEHPNIPNLYHAVFDDNFQNVCILDNRLCLVSGGKFPLLPSS